MPGAPEDLKARQAPFNPSPGDLVQASRRPETTTITTVRLIITITTRITITFTITITITMTLTMTMTITITITMAMTITITITIEQVRAFLLGTATTHTPLRVHLCGSPALICSPA